jgi:hypothetical protein
MSKRNGLNRYINNFRYTRLRLDSLQTISYISIDIFNSRTPSCFNPFPSPPHTPPSPPSSLTSIICATAYKPYSMTKLPVAPREQTGI